MKRILGAILVVLGAASLWAQQAADTEPPTEPVSPAPVAVESDGNKTVIFRIPIHGEIGQTTLFVVRRGVKDAISAHAQYVVLDMETPGGRGDVMMEIMKILENLEPAGIQSITYVNPEAISAGALIAVVTNAIYLAPNGRIGDAAPITGQGQDVDTTYRQKLTSYLNARIRSVSDDPEIRGEVVRAMMDTAFELKIGDQVVRPKDGLLLTLTAPEAMKEYGDPPQALLGDGIVEDLPELYRLLSKGREFEVREFEVTWSVKLAKWLTSSVVSSLLLSLGGLLIFIEFKTPGFGVIGISGIVLVVIVLFGHYVAGLSGHEAMIVFVLGFALVMLELLFFQGTAVLGVLGLVLMFGSLLWGMADVWPTKGFDIDLAMFVRPMVNLGISAILTVAMGAAALRFLPHSWIWDRIVLRGAISGVSARSGTTAEGGASDAGSLIGATGRAVTALFPSGEVEVQGHRFQARLDVGSAPAGSAVRIVRRADFVYIVEVVA